MSVANRRAETQPRSPFLTQLVVEVERLGLSGRQVLVAVSGGADSVALLRGLHALSAEAGLQVRAAHLNHGMRPGAADEDAAWTSELCARLGIPIVIETVDVPAIADGQGLNLEEAARNARYEFLIRSARTYGCSHVAVAHTADDQVETILFNLLRGTGLAGLRGMPASRPLDVDVTLVRPVLGARRSAVEAWLAEIGQDFRTDVTNGDTRRSRSRIRHILLPKLEEEFGPQLRGALQQLAAQAGEWQTVLESAANLLLDAALADDAGSLVRVDCEPLHDQPAQLVREAFVVLWKRKGWPRRSMGFADWERLDRLVKLNGGSSQAIDLPGRIHAARRGRLLILDCRNDPIP